MSQQERLEEAFTQIGSDIKTLQENSGGDVIPIGAIPNDYAKSSDYFYWGYSGDQWIVIRQNRETGAEERADWINNSEEVYSFDLSWAQSLFFGEPSQSMMTEQFQTIATENGAELGS